MCKGCGRGQPTKTQYTPRVEVMRVIVPAELVLVECISDAPEARYGNVTGNRYAFDEQARLYIDALDLDALLETGAFVRLPK